MVSNLWWVVFFFKNSKVGHSRVCFSIFVGNGQLDRKIPLKQKIIEPDKIYKKKTYIYKYLH